MSAADENARVSATLREDRAGQVEKNVIEDWAGEVLSRASPASYSEFGYEPSTLTKSQ
jgi:hypothetical protein